MKQIRRRGSGCLQSFQSRVAGSVAIALFAEAFHSRNVCIVGWRNGVAIVLQLQDTEGNNTVRVGA